MYPSTDYDFGFKRKYDKLLQSKQSIKRKYYGNKRPKSRGIKHFS